MTQNKNYEIFGFIATIFFILLAACIKHDNNSADAAAKAIVNILSQQDISTLAEWIHPRKGVQVSPYSHFSKQNDRILYRDTIETLWASKKKIQWGYYDGTGDPIILNTQDYFATFVNDRNYTKTHHVSRNKPFRKGNTLVNIKESFPHSTYIEFYIAGKNPKFNGMDWSSLRLVLTKDKNNGNWWLVGIGHGQWTI